MNAACSTRAPAFGCSVRSWSTSARRSARVTSATMLVAGVATLDIAVSFRCAPLEVMTPTGLFVCPYVPYCTLLCLSCQYPLCPVVPDCAKMILEVIAMADGAYRPPEGYMTMAQAQAVLGISKPTLQRMVRAGGLTAFRDQRNRRVRLVKAEDVERLAQPVPASEPEQGKAAA